MAWTKFFSSWGLERADPPFETRTLICSESVYLQLKTSLPIGVEKIGALPFLPTDDCSGGTDIHLDVDGDNERPLQSEVDRGVGAATID